MSILETPVYLDPYISVLLESWALAIRAPGLLAIIDSTDGEGTEVVSEWNRYILGG